MYQILILLIVILIFELYLISRILRYFLLSPIYLYVIFSLISIIFSVLYFYFYDDKFSLFNLDVVDEKAFLRTIKSYLIALISFVLAIIVYYDLSKKKSRRIFNRSFTNSLFYDYYINNKVPLLAGILFFLIIGLYIITYGKSIFIRLTYLPETIRELTIIIKILSFIEIIILAIIYNKYKLKSLFYFISLLLLSIGTGSRAVFLFFLIYILIIFISNGNTLKNKIFFTFNLFLSLLFLAYLMQLRSLDTHGIIPYFKSLLVSTNDFSESFFFNIYYSLIYGTFVTIRTVKEATHEWNIIFISINPLPGSLAGWYDYADKMRINIYAPYSLHGRVFKMGTIFTVTYFFITGLIFSYMERKVRDFLDKGKRILAYIIVLILALHIFYGFEYNMRSAIRYLYYALFVIGVDYLLRIILLNIPKKKNE